MKKAMRFAQGVLAAIVIGAMLSGCGTSPVSSTSGGNRATQAPAATQAAPAEIANVIWYAPGGTQPGQAAVMTYVNGILNKQYGLNLDFQIVDFGTYNDKMNMMISSQENFDLCMTTASWLNLYLPNVAKGAFVDITDLIDKDAPQLRQILPDFCFQQAKVNGRVYAIPNYQICYNSGGVQVKTPLLEKYGFSLDSVKKYEDMEPLLEKLKKGEPGFYPTSWEVGTLDLGNNNVVVDSIGNIQVGFSKSDPSMKVSFLQDSYKAVTDLANKWWKAGYIRQDRGIVQDDTADQNAGKYLTYIGCVIKPGGEAERKGKTDDHSDWTQKSLQTPFISSVAVRATMTAVSSSSKNPDAAVKMIGAMNENKDVFNALNFGLEGSSYTLSSEGKVVQKTDAPYWYNAAWAFGDQFNALLMDGQQDGIWEETDKINRNAEVSPISGFSFDQTPVSSEIAKISAVYQEYQYMQFFDNYTDRYKEFITKLDQAGMPAYVAEMQKQLDAWRQTQK